MKLDYHFVMTTLIVNYIILQVWKIINGVSPNEIGMRFSESSRRGTIAIIPVLAKGCSQRNQSLYDGSFTVLGARLWNVIPADIKSLKTFLAFKEKLSRFLDTFSDNPLYEDTPAQTLTLW